jgi:hypothetical protein
VRESNSYDWLWLLENWDQLVNGPRSLTILKKLLPKMHLDCLYKQLGIEPSKGEKLTEEEFDAYVNAVFPSKTTKERTNQMEERKMWAMYDVIMVDKDTLKIVIDDSVVAKSAEHAKGIVGVYDRLSEKNFDDTRFVVKIAHITDIKLVEDDEK